MGTRTFQKSGGKSKKHPGEQKEESFSRSPEREMLNLGNWYGKKNPPAPEPDELPLVPGMFL